VVWLWWLAISIFPGLALPPAPTQQLMYVFDHVMADMLPLHISLDDEAESSEQFRVIDGLGAANNGP